MDDLLSRPEPKTTAEYQAAFAALMDEITRMTTKWEQDRPQTERRGTPEHEDTLQALCREVTAMRQEIRQLRSELQEVRREQRHQRDLAERDREYFSLRLEHAVLRIERRLPPRNQKGDPPAL
jgi:predicted  nucleic acid-binding Zn-ribbon protein